VQCFKAKTIEPYQITRVAPVGKEPQRPIGCSKEEKEKRYRKLES
jgi:hypothetical protein